jgi:hypothetical protein
LLNLQFARQSISGRFLIQKSVPWLPVPIHSMAITAIVRYRPDLVVKPVLPFILLSSEAVPLQAGIGLLG